MSEKKSDAELNEIHRTGAKTDRYFNENLKIAVDHTIWTAEAKEAFSKKDHIKFCIASSEHSHSGPNIFGAFIKENKVHISNYSGGGDGHNFGYDDKKALLMYEYAFFKITELFCNNDFVIHTGTTAHDSMNKKQQKIIKKTLDAIVQKADQEKNNSAPVYKFVK